MENKNIKLNFNPYTFTGSAVFIGLILVNELTQLEQNSIGNWLQLVGLTVQTYASQKNLMNSIQNSKEENYKYSDLDTIEKTIDKIKEEINKLKNSS